MLDTEFKPMPKIPRYNREIIITEKIDGTNASIHISEDGSIIKAASRNRWITVGDDNYGFASWVNANRQELLKLGPGSHFGEWWGVGINRGYGLFERRFSLFNIHKWANNPDRPACCGVVPLLATLSTPNTQAIETALNLLRNGSIAAPGFKSPEGIVIFHTAAQQLFKITLEGDEKPKSKT